MKKDLFFLLQILTTGRVQTKSILLLRCHPQYLLQCLKKKTNTVVMLKNNSEVFKKKQCRVKFQQIEGYICRHALEFKNEMLQTNVFLCKKI